MIFTTKDLTLLAIEHKDFTGNDGKQVVYEEASLLDNDGNKFRMPMKKESAEKLDGTEKKVEGTATIELFVGNAGGKTVNKLRLIDWKTGK